MEIIFVMIVLLKSNVFYFLTQRFCAHNKPLHNYTLEYFLQFVKRYQKDSQLVAMDLLAAHELPATHELNRLRVLDLPLTKTIQTLLRIEKKLKREAVIFIMGDHGMHRGWYAYTDAGKVI